MSREAGVQLQQSLSLPICCTPAVAACWPVTSWQARIFTIQVTLSLRKWCSFHLCRKTLHMVLLCVESVLCDEEREVGILDAHFFDVAVEPALNELPHCEGPGAQYVAACKGASSMGF